VEWQEKIRTWYDDHLRNFKFGRDTGIFLIFLLISTLFWLLNQLSKDTTAQVRYPVHFYNSGEQRIIVNDPPVYLLLKVKGQGYKLIRYKMRPWRSPLEIDLRLFPLRPEKAGEAHHFYLLSSYMKGYVNDHLGENMVLEHIFPDTLRFVFDSLVKRRVPVRAAVVIEPARQYILKDTPRLVPDTVAVSGPAMILDTLHEIYTERREFKGVESSFGEDLSLIAPPHTTLSTGKVVLQVDVEQYTEAVYEIPLLKKNVPDTLSLRLFPSSVKVYFKVGLSRYKKLLPELFTAAVDYRDLQKEKTDKLPIHLEKYPLGIEAIRLEPERVEYLIERKK
jgi:hypothetical protein